MLPITNMETLSLADLKNKLDEIEEYLQLNKELLINNIVESNVNKYTFETNDFIKKDTVQDLTIDSLTVNNINGTLALNENGLSIGGHSLNKRFYDLNELSYGQTNPRTWKSLEVSNHIYNNGIHELNILFKYNNIIHTLFIVAENGQYSDVNNIITVSIADQNILFNDTSAIVGIYYR